MLYASRIKEEISLGYIQLVAAAANCVCEHIRVDIDSVDLTIIHSGKFTSSDRFRKQRIDIQMKATTNWEWKSDFCAFDLPIKNYNDLRHDSIDPAILVVYLMPSDSRLWIEHGEDALLARHCAYWHNLRGLPDVSNVETCRIYLNKCNFLSPDALQEMMRRIARQEEWGDVL